MAGDWLKFDKATPDKPEVFAIAAELEIDPDAVVGKLMRVWSWFDTHTENGNAPRVTPALLDRCAGVTGFVSAMQKSGWMVVESGGCSLPNFDRHCGETAKSRGLGAKRAAAFKVRNAPPVTSALPREEKRREENTNQKKELSPRKRGKQPKVAMPESFGISERVRTWAAEKGYHSLEQRLEHFRGKAKANSYAYADWDEAFMGAIRDDWAKIATKPATSVVQGKTKEQALAPSETPEERRRAQIWQDFHYDQITAEERDSRLAKIVTTERIQ